MPLIIYIVNVWVSWRNFVLIPLKKNVVSTLKFKAETQDYINQVPLTFLGFVLGSVKHEELKCGSIQSLAGNKMIPLVSEETVTHVAQELPCSSNPGNLVLKIIIKNSTLTCNILKSTGDFPTCWRLWTMKKTAVSSFNGGLLYRTFHEKYSHAFCSIFLFLQEASKKEYKFSSLFFSHCWESPRGNRRGGESSTAMGVIRLAYKSAFLILCYELNQMFYFSRKATTPKHKNTHIQEYLLPITSTKYIWEVAFPVLFFGN